MGVEMATESDFPMARRPMGVEMATEIDFPMTPHPMRVESASDGDLLTPEEKEIKRNTRLGAKEKGRRGVGRRKGRGRRRRGGHHHRVAGSSPAELDHRRL